MFNKSCRKIKLLPKKQAGFIISSVDLPKMDRFYFQFRCDFSPDRDAGFGICYKEDEFAMMPLSLNLRGKLYFKGKMIKEFEFK